MSLGKKIMAILMANLFMICFVASAIEAVLRFANYPFDVTWTPSEIATGRFDPELGWSYQPHALQTMTVEGREIEFRFDAEGVRIPSAGFALDSSRPSILLIGGSYTMGHGLAYEDSFAGQLGERVPSYQVVNLGVQGFGTDQSLLALRRHLPRFNTKLVIYTFIWDHYLRNGNRDRRLLFPAARFLGTKPQFSLDRNGALRQIHTPQRYEDYRHSWLLDLITMRLRDWLDNLPALPIYLTHALMAEMDATSRAAGARFVVLNWNWQSTERPFDDLGLEVLQTGDGAPAGWGGPEYRVGTHPNGLASEHVAGLIFDYLVDN